MQTRLLASLLFMATAFFLLAGCKKFYDYPNPSNGNVCDLCKITKLMVAGPSYTGGAAYEYDVTYNTRGDVMSVVRLGFDPVHPGAIDQHFRYDRSGRLTDYYMNYAGNTGAVIWHRYSYPDRYSIVDSQFNYVGNINDPEPPHTSFDMRFSIDKVDSKGRIIKNFDYSSYPPPVGYFSYNSYGNLVLPGISYDNKINPYRTNNTWQQVYNDYSMNNPNPGTIISYNEFGLPSDIKNENGFLFLVPFTEMQIEYDCGQAKALYK